MVPAGVGNPTSTLDPERNGDLIVGKRFARVLPCASRVGVEVPIDARDPEKFNIDVFLARVSLDPDNDRFVGPPYSRILRVVSGSIPTDLINDLTLCNVPFDLITSCKLVNTCRHILF